MKILHIFIALMLSLQAKAEGLPLSCDDANEILSESMNRHVSGGVRFTEKQKSRALKFFGQKMADRFPEIDEGNRTFAKDGFSSDVSRVLNCEYWNNEKNNVLAKAKSFDLVAPEKRMARMISEHSSADLILGLNRSFDLMGVPGDESWARIEEVMMLKAVASKEAIEFWYWADLIDSLLKGLDPHSRYLPENDLASYEDEISKASEKNSIAIGPSKSFDGMRFPMIAGGAERGVFHQGDILLAVKSGRSIDFLMIGDLGIARVNELMNGKRKARSYLIVRDKKAFWQTSSDETFFHRVPSILSKVYLVKGKRYGYIEIPSFYKGNEMSIDDDGLGSELADSLRSMKSQGVVSFIFDVRNNSGGYVSEMQRTVGSLIGPDVAIFMSKNPRDEEKIHFSQGDKVIKDTDEILVLIDKNSKSAAELFAGVLQEKGRAFVLGEEPSYGKGLIQELSIAKSARARFGKKVVTSELYFFMDGLCLQAKGVVPNNLRSWDYLKLPTNESHLLKGYEDFSEELSKSKAKTMETSRRATRPDLPEELKALLFPRIDF